MKVAAESTVEAAAGEEVLAVRRAFVSRVSRWSRDSPPASGPGSGLRARRLDPPSLEVCDIKEGIWVGHAETTIFVLEYRFAHKKEVNNL